MGTMVLEPLPTHLTELLTYEILCSACRTGKNLLHSITILNLS
jgi:hypothetical protein